MGLFAQMSAVTGVLALLALTLWWLRRHGFASGILPRRAGRRTIESLEHTLHLIRLGDQALLVACSPAGCALVAARPWREPDLERGRPS
jgi:hypothetical protein